MNTYGEKGVPGEVNVGEMVMRARSLTPEGSGGGGESDGAGGKKRGEKVFLRAGLKTSLNG